MPESRFTEEQITAVLKAAEGGQKVADLCREHGIDADTLCAWWAKYNRTGIWAARKQLGFTPEGLVEEDDPPVAFPLLEEETLEALSPEDQSRLRPLRRWQRTRREVGRGGLVVLEARLSAVTRDEQVPTVWEYEDDGLVGLAGVVVGLERQQKSWARKGSLPEDLAFNLAAARERLRRYVSHRRLLQLPDDDARGVVKMALANVPKGDVSDADATRDSVFNIALEWFHQNYDVVDVYERNQEVPVFVLGSTSDAVWRLLQEASEAYTLSLFRLAIAGCRSIIEAVAKHAVTTRRLERELEALASRRKRGTTLGPTLADRIDVLDSVLTLEIRREMHEIRDRGNGSLHDGAPIERQCALAILQATRRVMDAMGQRGLLRPSDQ